MSTDLSALLSGLRTGASGTSTVGSAILQRFFNITGANGQREPFSLPWDATNLNFRAIITTAGSAATSNGYTVKKSGVAADVMKIASVGSAAGNFTTFTTTSASLIANPGGTAGSQDPISMVVSGVSTDAATRGVLLVSYMRTNGSTDGIM